ncbi:MAG: hypothetical protein U9N77_04480 [Thermodesulfobacteriota bacterium]|nr:hypothetical protein [Thermodesulfobacteriota bacterium]
MDTTTTLKTKLTRLDKDYLDPISEFFQEQTVKTGKSYVIKPLAQLLTEMANTSVDTAFSIADHFHKTYDNAREKVKDRKGRQGVKDGARELRAIIIEKALDVNNPISSEDVDEIHRRILFLNFVVQMLNMSEEVNLFSEEFEHVKLQIKEQKNKVLQLQYKNKEQTVGAMKYLADLFRI